MLSTDEPTDSAIPTLSPLVFDSASTVVQILFWCLVGTLSLLTYLHARRTVFQPLKTEVFKLQIAALTHISEELHGKGEWELVKDFDLDWIVHEGSWRILHQYGLQDLQAGSNLGDLLGTLDAQEMSQNPASHWNRLKPTWTPLEPSKVIEREEFTKLSRLHMSKKFLSAKQKLKVLSADPLLPTEVSQALDEFIDRVERNSHLLMRLSEAIAPGLRDQYPTIESLNKANVGWIHNKWNDAREKLEPAATNVLAKIREYYQPDLIGFVKTGKKPKGRKLKFPGRHA